MMLRRVITMPGLLCLFPILLLNGASAYADTGPDERDVPETAVVYRSSDFIVVDASSPTVSQSAEARFFLLVTLIRQRRWSLLRKVLGTFCLGLLSRISRVMKWCV